jgi:hypothetical protein
MATLRKKPVKIGAKVVRYGRHTDFQRTVSTIPNAWFAETLRESTALASGAQ